MNMNISKMIDHTILKCDAQQSDIERICDEAIKYNFASVCINGSNVSQASKILMKYEPKVACVVGFPLGAMCTEIKSFEAKKAIEDGADEIDMVMNIGAFKDKRYDFVLRDIQSVVSACGDKCLKVILETALLNKEEIVKACLLAKEAGAQFVKTSTGFNSTGASIEAVQTMSATVGDSMGVKASGGIKSYEDAIKMVNAGATRLGCSSSVQIVTGEISNKDY